MSDFAGAVPAATVFEHAWDQPDGHLFKSEAHGVLAVADRFPRMPLQVVVALSKRTPGVEQQFYDLDLTQQRKVLEVGLVVGSKILKHCAPGQRSMFTLEGFAVTDHAHVVYYAGARGQGIDRYTGPILGDDAVRQTSELITFSPDEAREMEARLDQITQY